MPIKNILFDLDGTLLDTASDLGFALNQLLKQHGLAEMPLAMIRPFAGMGVRSLLKLAFQIEMHDPKFESLREQFIHYYQKHLTDSTQLFPGMEKVLAHLEEKNIRWGIVTNKYTQFALPILEKMSLTQVAACIVCGDTLATSKPDPEPILHACRLMGVDPADCVYVGDTLTDVTASKAAGMKSMIALYGYTPEGQNPLDWQADGYIQHPLEMLEWLK